MRQLRAQAELLAQADVPVLILGEPGSGKDTVARLIHQRSVHSGFRFLRVNCAEMPADLLESELFGRENGASAAHRKLRASSKLARRERSSWTKSRRCRWRCNRGCSKSCKRRSSVRSGDAKPVEVDVRILAASSDKMDAALAEKRMHPDLYYRLSAFTVHVPALRHRQEEIKVLLRYSMRKLAKHYGLPSARLYCGGVRSLSESFLAGKFERAGDLRQALSDRRR